MIGLIENSTIIGKGEHREFVITIKDDEGIFSSNDTLLFAIADIDGNIKYTFSELISNLEIKDGAYNFNVILNSATTLSLDVGTYFFDITLVKQSGEKYPFTNIQSIKIVKTVGASIGE